MKTLQINNTLTSELATQLRVGDVLHHFEDPKGKTWTVAGVDGDCIEFKCSDQSRWGSHSPIYFGISCEGGWDQLILISRGGKLEPGTKLTAELAKQLKVGDSIRVDGEERTVTCVKAPLVRLGDVEWSTDSLLGWDRVIFVRHAEEGGKESLSHAINTELTRLRNRVTELETALKELSTSYTSYESDPKKYLAWLKRVEIGLRKLGI